VFGTGTPSVCKWTVYWRELRNAAVTSLRTSGHFDTAVCEEMKYVCMDAKTDLDLLVVYVVLTCFHAAKCSGFMLLKQYYI